MLIQQLIWLATHSSFHTYAVHSWQVLKKRFSFYGPYKKGRSVLVFERDKMKHEVFQFVHWWYSNSILSAPSPLGENGDVNPRMKEVYCPLHGGEFYFRKAVGGTGYCNALRHSSSQFYIIKDLNNMIISQMFSGTGLTTHTYFILPKSGDCYEQTSFNKL